MNNEAAFKWSYKLLQTVLSFAIVVVEWTDVAYRNGDQKAMPLEADCLVADNLCMLLSH